MITTCIKCGMYVEVPVQAQLNMSQYGGSVVVGLPCGHGAVLTAVSSFRVDEYTGSAKEDDWGNTITQ